MQGPIPVVELPLVEPVVLVESPVEPVDDALTGEVVPSVPLLLPDVELDPSDALIVPLSVWPPLPVGVPDPLLGEAVIAFVVPRPGSSLHERALQRHCADALDSGLAPQRVLFVNSLPRTETGKVRKQDLAETLHPSTQDNTA